MLQVSKTRLRIPRLGTIRRNAAILPGRPWISQKCSDPYCVTDMSRCLAGIEYNRNHASTPPSRQSIRHGD